MHFYEKKLIELGGIDTEIVRIYIDDWFENVTIAYIGKNNKEVICNFKQCFEISLRHDRDYSKEKNSDGNLNYKYFIQDIDITENDGFYVFKISAWPLEGAIICKEICIDMQD